MRISIMQPYIFPYIGYFHLIEASDKFIFYDDVNFIKRGWINRNRIFLNGKDCLFTVPVSKISQNKLINEVYPIIDVKWEDKFKKSIEYSYSKSLNYEEVSWLIRGVFDEKYTDITDLCIKSIKLVYDYLDMGFDYTKSSIFSPETKGIEKADRLIAITKKSGAIEYVNSIGGKSLYKKRYFEESGIKLHFVKSKLREYKQFNSDFIVDLSILDVLMFNDKERVKDYFRDYELL